MTGSSPPLEFRFRTQPEDFVVEELPAFPPSGSGQHLWLWIEKRDLTTHAAIERLCKLAGVARAAAGHSGLKDKRAVARQALTLDGASAERLAGHAETGLTVLEVARHKSKLRPGQHRGNRFELRLRGLLPAHRPEFKRRLAELGQLGFANGFGAQRLGLDGRHGEVGLAWLRGDLHGALEWLLARPLAGESGRLKLAREQAQAGDWLQAAALFPRGYEPEARACRTRAVEPDRPQAALSCLPGPSKRLFLEAGQAALFNAWLALRGADLGQLLAGDVCQPSGSRGSFVVRDLALDQARSRAFEISPAGPLFGSELFPAEGPAAELEDQVLRAAGLSRASFASQAGARLSGERRVRRVRPGEPVCGPDLLDELGPYLTLSFSLPPGSFATALLDALSGGAARDASQEAPASDGQAALEGPPPSSAALNSGNPLEATP